MYVTIFLIYNVIKSYTIETSICGSDITPTKGLHYSINILSKIGRSFGKTVFFYFKNCSDDINYEKMLLKEIGLYSGEKNDDRYD